MYVEQCEEAETNSADVEAEEMEGLTSTLFGEEDNCYNSSWDGDGDNRKELHSSAARRGAEDCLEVDW